MLITVDVPGVDLDGAVVEVYVRDGRYAADVRIPAPEVSDGRTETLARQDL